MPRAANPDLPRLLLEAALALLDERGGPDFGLREVAARAGYTVTAVYRCHANRDALIAELRRRLAAGLGLHLGVDPATPVADSLRDLASRFVTWGRDYPARFRLLLDAAPGASTSPWRAVIGAIENVLSRAAHPAPLPAEKRHLQARLIVASLIGLTALTLAGDAGERASGRWPDASLEPLLRSILDQKRSP